MQQLNKLIIENKALRNENDTLKAENTEVKQRISQFDENAVIDEIDCSAAVQKAFATLDVAEQIVMQLAIYEDKTIVQIAKELDMSKSQVGRIKLSAIAKLKTALEASGYGKTDEN